MLSKQQNERSELNYCNFFRLTSTQCKEFKENINSSEGAIFNKIKPVSKFASRSKSDKANKNARNYLVKYANQTERIYSKENIAKYLRNNDDRMLFQNVCEQKKFQTFESLIGNVYLQMEHIENQNSIKFEDSILNQNKKNLGNNFIISDNVNQMEKISNLKEQENSEYSSEINKDIEKNLISFLDTLDLCLNSFDSSNQIYSSLKSSIKLRMHRNEGHIFDDQSDLVNLRTNDNSEKYNVDNLANSPYLFQIHLKNSLNKEEDKQKFTENFNAVLDQNQNVSILRNKYRYNLCENNKTVFLKQNCFEDNISRKIEISPQINNFMQKESRTSEEFLLDDVNKVK